MGGISTPSGKVAFALPLILIGIWLGAFDEAAGDRNEVLLLAAGIALVIWGRLQARRSRYRPSTDWRDWAPWVAVAASGVLLWLDSSMGTDMLRSGVSGAPHDGGPTIAGRVLISLVAAALWYGSYRRVRPPPGMHPRD